MSNDTAKRSGWSFVALLFLGACEPAANPPIDRAQHPATISANVADAAAPAAIDVSTFTILHAAAPIGTETWKLSRASDGSVTNDFTASVGPATLKGTMRFAPDSSVRSANIDLRVGGSTSTMSLSSESPSDGHRLVLTTTQPGKPVDVTHETESSQLFLARPSMAGLLPICLRPLAEGDSLHVFPGAAVHVLSVKPLDTGAREIVLDFAGTIRIEVACEADHLAVVRVPLQDVSYARNGSERELTAMRKLDAPKKPAIPDSLVDEDRTVDVPAKGSDMAATLSCSFLRPRNPTTTKLPAVIFITGSGPEDRDEDSVGEGGLKLAIFKTMAIRLANAGIASLRCDDRGTAKSTGDFSAATLDTYIRDAHATFDAVRKEKIVDPARVGIVGHSEGGIVAPRFAATDKSVRALFLMAAPGESFGDMIVRQLKSESESGGAPAEQTAKLVASTTAVMDAIRNQKPLPDDLDPAKTAAMEKARAWLHSELVNDPVRVIGKVTCPVFLAQGAKDEQVSPDDVDVLLKALQKSGNRRVQAKTYPELNHLFAPTKTGSMADYSDPGLTVSEEFLGDAVSFLSGTLKK